MFQTFDTPSTPDQGPPRLAALRDGLTALGLSGFLVPRADAHQGEYVAPRDDRLAWLTGFTGSAGLCIVGQARAAVFVDGRYTVQVRDQVDPEFDRLDWSAPALERWLARTFAAGDVIGFDPWLHTGSEIRRLTAQLPDGVTLQPLEANPLDAIWPDQPAPPRGVITPHPIDFAGEPHADKIARLAEQLRNAGQSATVLSLPDSIAWLLNIRGSDIARNPVPHCFAVLDDEGQVRLFAADPKVDDLLVDHLGPDVAIEDPSALLPTLEALAENVSGPIRIDPASCPVALRMALQEAELVEAPDPCALPKACKNPTEIEGSRQAHLRDGVAMCRFLAWFAASTQTRLTEIDLVTRLEIFRRETDQLLEISFETIAGAGPHGALPHYRVTRESNTRLADGQLVVLDSGGQYLDGTTDITRTLLVGDTAGEAERAAYTRVLQGMIAMSRVRFPRGVAGMHLDTLARYPLWLAGLDYDHGTGHGVGSYLCVHEGPQRLSRLGDVVLRPGMILSNEPGYYREGAFGMRIENLLAVREAAPLPDGDARDMLEFETLTYVPIETRLLDSALLSEAERDWINDYHAECRRRLRPLLDASTQKWLDRATEKL